ncbi:hypothetical protein [Pseudomonas sp. TTU2014-080ASC]|uniref:hypothetical protein n=1 Tax=Pseudomonas sp. TTU2014-080ASC TaxID=1729724 RepID=UPI0007187CE9|nr:hypothetical protein [Pseudomonas sp. TTU2014-080ASC]KRW58625.1 MFS transporter [Pseudomonas sp. TTU2014-080ASC]
MRGAGAISWLLAQTLWVGGLWLLHFLVLPAIAKTGMASLLVEELSNTLRPLVVGLSGVCVLIQAFVLVRAEGLGSVIRDVRGQLLLTVVLVSVGYFYALHWLEEPQYWLMFGYLLMAFAGLMLVLQPVPERSGRAQL